MADITIELTTHRHTALSPVTNILWAAIQKVSDDLESISMAVDADVRVATVATATTVATAPAVVTTATKVKRRQSKLGRHAELTYRPSGAGGRFRKIEIEESLRQNAMTLPQLLDMTTRRGTWQNALKMASLTSTGRWGRTNGGSAVAAV
jgi:hypothetical protein